MAFDERGTHKIEIKYRIDKTIKLYVTMISTVIEEERSINTNQDEGIQDNIKITFNF